jgi:2-phosphoglycerate kinase
MKRRKFFFQLLFPDVENHGELFNSQAFNLVAQQPARRKKRFFVEIYNLFEYMIDI